jgi:hypothetical protein
MRRHLIALFCRMFLSSSCSIREAWRIVVGVQLPFLLVLDKEGSPLACRFFIGLGCVDFRESAKI